MLITNVVAITCIPVPVQFEQQVISDVERTCAQAVTTPDVYRDIPKLSRLVRSPGGIIITIQRNKDGRIVGMSCRPSKGLEMTLNTAECGGKPDARIH